MILTMLNRAGQICTKISGVTPTANPSSVSLNWLVTVQALISRPSIYVYARPPEG
jgi:hypothetical protein